MNGEHRRPSVLDRPAARLVTAAIALAGLALLGWIHRDDLFPSDPADAVPDSPKEAAFRACLEPQAARFAASREAGELTEEQAALFLSRAEAFCADQAEKGRLPPPH